MTSWSSFAFHISLLLLRFNLKILTTLLFFPFLVIYIQKYGGVHEILNHMGQFFGYHMAESMETEIASSIVAEGKLLADLLLHLLGLSTGLGQL